VKDVLRRRVRFHQLNLLQPPYPFSQLFHVILCRNVMIYFDRPTQELLIGHLAERLLPGGHLLVGHSESLSAIKHPLQLVQPAIYLKPRV
jgi:chemotaxis protein methyltransferase CheR